MTDYHEEQAMEVEALEAIYMDEFTKLTEDPLSYEVHISPHQDGENNHVAIKLACRIPETYPDVKPHVEVIVEKGLSEAQKQETMEILAKQMDENAGFAMIYTLCEAAREYLLENNNPPAGGSEYEQMLQRMQVKDTEETQEEVQEEEEEPQVKVPGTPLTEETFRQWKAEKKARLDALKPPPDPAMIGKLTGRQLWERGQAKEEEEVDEPTSE